MKPLILGIFLFGIFIFISQIRTDIYKIRESMREMELEAIFKSELEECRNSKTEMLVYPYWCIPRDDGKFTLELIKGGLK